MSKVSKRMILIALLSFITILLVVISIYFYKAIAGQTHETDQHGLDDVTTVTDLEGMIDEADVIVLGTYEGLDSTWNMASDAEKESDLYIAGKLYTFHVQEVLKGSLPEEEIMVNHRYSLPFHVEKTFGYQDNEVEAVDPTYISPSFNKRYIAFLMKSESGDFYIRAQEPYLISVDNHDLVKVESKVLEELGFDPSVTGKTLAEIKMDITSKQ